MIQQTRRPLSCDGDFRLDPKGKEQRKGFHRGAKVGFTFHKLALVAVGGNQWRDGGETGGREQGARTVASGRLRAVTAREERRQDV